MADGPVIQGINAVTIPTRNMERAVRFYCALGFKLDHGGEDALFTSFKAGSCHVNLSTWEDAEEAQRWPGRVIFYVTDVDALYRLAEAQGLEPSTEPRDAEWGERYFHILDPDGHELSFAKRL